MYVLHTYVHHHYHYHYLIYQFDTEGHTQKARPVQSAYS